MGEHEKWAEPGGLLPNGLLPNAGLVFHVLDSERWLKAEERTAELIACIQPNKPSEERRNAVADYVQRLIMKCFPCQVFTFGSVPLKTYLPDGDIDLTAFSNNQTLKDTWANQVRDMLENEEKNEQAEFCVKEVQYIQAEVKIIKCLVENIVVDISFNQLGGLCTLCFLEEVDHLINHNHLFKRSIVLIKAWCYYESRILGAHHGLISTYALETLVLYIFHVFNNSFTGPLEVLYRFLEFFSNFDWDSFCVSLWGPVPISSLPDVTAEPPRKDSGNLLLSKLFLDACSTVYAVFPTGQENQSQSFVSKHFNVIDPLRVNNNLGRSVSKGNFFRIRSAFAFGAKRLARLLECPKENLIYEVNQFFMNTWERHGSGRRPDAPEISTQDLKLSTADILSKSDNFKSNRGTKSNIGAVSLVDAEGSPSVASQQNHYLSASISGRNDLSTTSNSQTRRTHVNVNSSRVSDHTARESTSNHVGHVDEGQRSHKSDHMVNDINGRFLFARTRSSPELTETYGDMSTQVRHHRAPEGSKTQTTRLDGNNRKKNQGSDRLASPSVRSSTDFSSVRMAPSHQGVDAAADSVSGSNSYHHDSGYDALNEELSSTMVTQGLHHEEQDLVNMMESTSLHHFNGHPLPFNLPSSHLPFTIPPSFLASLGYTQRNMPGLVPSNVPFIDPSVPNVQFPHGFVPQPLAHRVPGLGLNSNLEYSSEQSNEIFGSVEAETDFWQDQEVGSSGGFETENGSLEMLPSDERRQSALHHFNIVDPSWLSGSGTSVRVQQRHYREKHGVSQREEHLDNYHFQDNSGAEAFYDERMASSRFSSASHSNPLRSRVPESSWDGSSAKDSKSMRERRGKKVVATELAGSYGKGKNMPEHAPNYIEDDDHECDAQPHVCAEVLERNPGAQSVAFVHAPRHQVPGSEVAQTSGSDPTMPVAPMFMGSGSWARENSGLVAFYPTGPPVPFLTMLPVYDVAPETGALDTTQGHFGREERLEDNDTSPSFDSTEVLDHSEDINTSTSFRLAASVATSDEHKSDILNSDFASHFQNMQFGRFCQNPPNPEPMFYQTPVMIPPGYLQGRFPWDGPGRPLPTNFNLLTQLMGYGSRVVPGSPLQSLPNRPNVYQRFADDIPKHRSGTGTYLPNPKVSVRDRPSSNSRRGSYHYDRNDSHGDKEGNWNVNSKSRAAGRSFNRSQAEKSIPRLDRLPSSESRSDRSWGPYRNESFSSFPAQNGALRSNSSMGGPPSVSYGLYPLPSGNPAGVPSNGPSVQSVVMLYPFEQNANFGPHGEQLEFGSLGPIGVTGVSDSSHASDLSRARGAFDEHRFHEASGQRSSPDQPSSPHHRRRI